MKDDRLYLIHMSECIDRVEEYVQGGKERFLGDTKTQDAVLRNLQTLAESSQRLSDDLKRRHVDIDWKAISGFRNVVVHDYLGVDIGQIWDIVANDLPPLKEKIRALLKK